MAIKFLDIIPRLYECGAVSHTNAAHTTLSYAVQWSQGVQFDFSKSAVKTHRARLRKIGLDIAKPYEGQIVFVAG